MSASNLCTIYFIYKHSNLHPNYRFVCPTYITL